MSPTHPATTTTLADGMQREAQAQRALNDLFPHLRIASRSSSGSGAVPSDAALSDIFVSPRRPVPPEANT